MSRNVRSLLALVVLTLFLGTGAAHALPPEGRDADRGSGMLVAVWEWVTSLLGMESSYRSAHEAAIISPPTETSSSSGCDFGGYIDPNGCPSGR